MNKQEALQKIKELQEYIEEYDKKPQVKRGQLWQHLNGDIYMTQHPRSGVARDSAFKLAAVVGSAAGNLWSGDGGFGYSATHFTYIGMAKDLLTVK